MDQRVRRTAVAMAGLGALAYSVSKVDLALREELGMPGFPAPAEAYRGFENVSAAQLGNAAMGLLAALAIAALWHPIERRWLRWGVVGGSWLGVVTIGAGVVGFAARALGVAPMLGSPPPQGFPAFVALTVGALWATCWAVAVSGFRAPDGRHPAHATRQM